LERRIKLVSEREDEMWKQFGAMNDNFQGLYKQIGKIEDKLSELEISSIDERSRHETSMDRETISYIRDHFEKLS
jgi:hypothetical protein